jgi:SHS2 domain-containing protein
LRLTDRVDSFERLERKLRDPHVQVRARSAAALGESGDRRAVEALAAALQDGSGLVRSAAAAALAALNDPAALPPLQTALAAEPDGPTRRALSAAIAAIAGRPAAGFRELEHTADWALEAWASNEAGLLEQAARGMFALSGARLADRPRLTYRIELQAADLEGLLVAFLREILWLCESERLGFDTYALSLHGLALNAQLHGAPLLALDKEIKAVTYHNLQVERTPGGLSARLVFDV